jgi:hypothetical protein
MTRYLLLFDSYGLVIVGRPLWGEDGWMELDGWNLSVSQSQSHIATDGRSVSQSVSLRLLLFDSYGLFLWGALSDERTGLSFAGPGQRSLSRVRV